MSDLVLFSTSGCHLCELAEGLLQQHRLLDDSITWTVIDIANDDQLFERYGWLIPVLAMVRRNRSDGNAVRPDGTGAGGESNEDRGAYSEVKDRESSDREHTDFGGIEAESIERELRWPFDERSLAAFLGHNERAA